MFTAAHAQTPDKAKLDQFFDRLAEKNGIDGFRSLLVYLPEEKLAVAYTSNAKVYLAANIVSGVFDIYYLTLREFF